MKGRIVAIGLVSFLCFAAIGCGQTTQESSEEVETARQTTTIESDGLTIDVPAEWKVMDAEDGKYIYPDFDGLLYLMTESDAYDGSPTDSFYFDVVDGMERDGSTKLTSEPEVSSVGAAISYRSDIESTIDGKDYKGKFELIISGASFYAITFIVPSDDYSSAESQIDSVFGTIALNNAESPMLIQQNVLDETVQEPGETVSQKNAVEKARSYLRYSAFSYDGLVRQLEFEGFAHDDAVYGADSCGADWMAQAEAKARDYISFSAFSYAGLIDQLEFEGFSHDEAVHGADSCGADWYEQAAKKAADYMSYSSFSYDELIDQLEFEGFTEEQAAYGATSVGLQ